MLIQTDADGRVIGTMERTFTDEDGNVVEQDVTGFDEVDPGDWDGDSDLNDYVVVDGRMSYNPVDRHAGPQVGVTTVEDLALGLAELASMVAELGGDDGQDIR